MVENTKIEWADHTFNPWMGCSKVGPGCDHCYAEALVAHRFGKDVWGPGKERQLTKPQNWSQPVRWNRQAEISGKRPRVFCASLADVFDNEVPEEWRVKLFDLIKATPHLDWLLLTKRIGNVKKMLPPGWGEGWPNVWLGITVVNQEEADRDIPKLLLTQAHKRFLSMEPLLGPVQLWKLRENFCETPGGEFREVYPLKGLMAVTDCDWDVPKIDWVIVGGESGLGARPMNPKWVRTIQDQCAFTKTPFFFKQWGEWLPGENLMLERPCEPAQWQDGEIGIHPTCADHIPESKTPEWRHSTKPGEPGAFFLRVGKKRAGRKLDGNIFSAVPRA